MDGYVRDWKKGLHISISMFVDMVYIYIYIVILISVLSNWERIQSRQIVILPILFAFPDAYMYLLFVLQLFSFKI